MVSGWDKNPGPDNDYASGEAAPGWLVLVIFALILVAGLVYAATANAASKGPGGPSAEALVSCGVRSAVKIAGQPGDPLVLAKTLPYLCNGELVELERGFIRQYGSAKGRKIFKLARYRETMVELGTATIVKERMRRPVQN